MRRCSRLQLERKGTTLGRSLTAPRQLHRWLYARMWVLNLPGVDVFFSSFESGAINEPNVFLVHLLRQFHGAIGGIL